MSDPAGAVPETVRDAVAAWIDAHDRFAPGIVEGLYLVGSVALGDWRPGSDIDIVAFTADAVTDEAVADRLEAAHAAAVGRIGTDIDGPYLAWGDVTVPPLPMLRPWTLHDEFHLDGDCFEINPVTWFTLARYGVAVDSPAPDRLDVAVDTERRRAFVHDNTTTYWRGVAEQIDAAIADTGRAEFDPAMTEWCALGVDRMLFTHATGDVASKTAAGEWAAGELPAHAAVLHRAIAIRSGDGAAEPDDRATVVAVRDLVTDIVARIAG